MNNRRTLKPCPVDGCEKIIKDGAALCAMHGARLRRTGTTDLTRAPGRPATPAIERFVRSVQFGSNIYGGTRCLEWVGIRNADGYGRFGSHPSVTSRGHVMVQAHRWLYERWVGPIPDGLQLDHLCRVRHCVNPDHLEPVTSAENTRRGRAFRSSDTHCPHGALWSDPCKSCSAREAHGTRSRYGSGCRCDPCRVAERDYKSARKAALK